MRGGERLLTLSGGEVLTRARAAVEDAADAGTTDAALIAAMDALSGLTRYDLVQVAATLAVALARGEVLVIRGAPPDVAQPTDGS